MKEIGLFDVIVIGAGPAGIMASISASKDNKSVLLLEKLPKIAAKLKATGGGKCNLTNTLSSSDFMEKFGKNGRFMSYALEAFTAKDLRDFFTSIGVESHAPDGFRVFPITHSSSIILQALDDELKKQNVCIECNVNIKEINKNVVIVFDNDYKTNKDINKLLNDVIDQGYSVVLYDVEMDGYKDINQYARDKNKTVEDITAYLQKCTYSDLNAKMFLASKKRKRGSIQWANESTASTQKTNRQKSNAKSRQLGQRKSSVFKI
jgi:hypothetical protein